MNPKDNKWILYVSVTFTVVGAVMLFFGVRSYFSTVKFLKIALSATGIVIDFDERIEEEKTDNGGTREVKMYYPYVKFMDKAGKEVEFLSKSGWSNPGFKVGDNIPVLYNPKNPEDARINKFFDVWGMPLILSILGTGFLFFGTLFTILILLGKI